MPKEPETNELDTVETPKPDTDELSEAPESPKAEKVKSDGLKFTRLKRWYVTHKKISIPLSVLLFVLIIFAIPFTRFPLVGIFLKKDASFQIVDSTTNTPVSGATVTIGKISGTTDGTGNVTLHKIKVGNNNVAISKKYYQDKSTKQLVPIFGNKKLAPVPLVASGRQVKIVVTNLISKSKVAGAHITIKDITAQSDTDGSATVVLPIGTTTEKAEITRDGYNKTTADITVENASIKENPVSLTPAGQVFFLSKLSGKIDVVKSNLDGTGRTTVLAGTGKEADGNTIMLASRDWKYLALLANRDGKPKLYLVEAASGALSTIDEGDASFDPVGWSDSHFIYTVTRNNLKNWEPKRQALKSFSADSKKLITIDETKAGGNSTYDYIGENFGNIYTINQRLVYSKNVYTYFVYLSSPSKVDHSQFPSGIYSASNDAAGAKTLKTFATQMNKAANISSVPYEAKEVYYQVSDQGATSYFQYENEQVASKPDIADKYNEYFTDRTTYLLSPTSKETVWNASRDGKNSILLGNESGDDGKQIANLADYIPYGWYSNDYVLLSKNGSELYVMPRTGITGTATPTKITDYHKPSRSFLSYGGGYGGL